MTKQEHLCDGILLASSTVVPRIYGGFYISSIDTSSTRTALDHCSRQSPAPRSWGA